MDFLYPLSAFYLEAGLEVPDVAAIDPADIPEPHRKMLVHNNFMTPTLEEALQARVALRVMKQKVQGATLLRQVRLVLDQTDATVEMAAIAIYLDEFPSELHGAILSGLQPLGAILRQSGLAVTCRPTSFFAFSPDVMLRDFLHAEVTQNVLYGRKALLKGPGGNTVADVVEILPVIVSDRSLKTQYFQDE